MFIFECKNNNSNESEISFTISINVYENMFYLIIKSIIR